MDAAEVDEDSEGGRLATLLEDELEAASKLAQVVTLQGGDVARPAWVEQSRQAGRCAHARRVGGGPPLGLGGSPSPRCGRRTRSVSRGHGC
eukprot:scaffold110367_cov22-Tisochrysis_lutea.AAC.1